MRLTLSALREAPTADGKPGPFSARRVLAACLFAPAGVVLLALGLRALPTLPSGVPAWAVVLPGALCLGMVLVLVVCTTVADIVAIIRAARGAP